MSTDADPFGLDEKCAACGHNAQAHDGRCLHPDGCSCEEFAPIRSADFDGVDNATFPEADPT